jgi:hypothetical protein
MQWRNLSLARQASWLAAVLALPLVACGSDTLPSVSPSMSLSPATPSVATPPPSASPSPSQSAAIAACTAAGLSATVGQADEASGSDYAQITLTNSGSVSCTVTGFPGLALIGTSGSPLPLSVDQDLGLYSTPPPQGSFPLTAGATAVFILEWTQGPYDSAGQECPEAIQIQITPPGQAAHTNVPATTADGVTIEPCGSSVTVGPLVQG